MVGAPKTFIIFSLTLGFLYERVRVNPCKGCYAIKPTKFEPRTSWSLSNARFLRRIPCKRRARLTFSARKYMMIDRINGVCPSQIEASSTASMGAISELIACAEFLRFGFDVFRSVSPTSSSDIVVVKNNIAKTLDVKTARGSREEFRIATKKNISIRCDFYCAVIPETCDVFMVKHDGKEIVAMLEFVKLFDKLDTEGIR